MAKKEQCISCKFYNKNASLCYKDWTVINFNNKTCDISTDTKDNTEQETFENQKQNIHSAVIIDPILSQQKNEENQKGTNVTKKRHWLVSAWLYLGLFMDVIAIIVLFFLISAEASELKIFLLVDFFVDLFARIFLFRWNKLGFYIKLGYICLGLLVDLIAILIGQYSGSLFFNNSGLIGFLLMCWIFSIKTSDGLSFFDHIGVRTREKKPVKKIINTKKEYRI